MNECGHMPPKAYECVQCLLNEIADMKAQLADSDIVFGHGWREAVETVEGKRVFNTDQHHCTLVSKIKEQQEAIWDLQEMYSELEAERNKINGKLHKAYDLAAETVQECGCRCKPNRRKCDLCDAAGAVLLLKGEQDNSEGIDWDGEHQQELDDND